MNIYQKIAAVMKDIRYLAKDDQIEFKSTKYRAISEEKVTSAVRESLIRHGLVILPIEQSHSRKETLSTVDVVYRIQNIEDPDDFICVSSSGTGVDTQDKGVGKAMTYAYKYMMLRTFAIPTGEDPDKISSAELDAKAAADAEAARLASTCPACGQIAKDIKTDGKRVTGSEFIAKVGYCYECHKRKRQEYLQREAENPCEDSSVAS